ncbi:MAG: outer membrane beta-barrel protein [Tidjanibacter sp.]|nr:outer membrane beta-barrel protein [Tidjanibacter sp.]
MKRTTILSFLLIAALIASSTTRTTAQENRFDARLGVGFYSFDDFVSVFGMIGDAFNKVDHREGYSYLLNPNLSVSYRLNDWLSLGAGVALGNMNTQGFDYANTLIHSREFAYTTAVVAADTYYLRRGVWALYGSYGLGATLFANTTGDLNDDTKIFEKTTTTSCHINFKFYPIAVQIGHRFGGFLEVGWGCNGLLNGGLFYRF